MAIGRLFHIIHMTDDLAAIEAWYEDVFSPYPMMESSYAESLRRDVISPRTTSSRGSRQRIFTPTSANHTNAVDT